MVGSQVFPLLLVLWVILISITPDGSSVPIVFLGLLMPAAGVFWFCIWPILKDVDANPAVTGRQREGWGSLFFVFPPTAVLYWWRFCR